MVDFPDAGSLLTGTPLMLLIFVGFILAFFGKNFFKITWFLIGGLIGASIAGIIGWMFGAAIYDQTICTIIAVIVGFVAGGFIMLARARRLMCFAMAAASFWMAYSAATAFGSDFGTALLIGVVVGVVIFIIVYIKFDDVLSVITAIVGGFMIGALLSVVYFKNNVVVMFAVAIPIAIMGMIVQLQLYKKFPDQSYDKDTDEKAQQS